MSEIDVTQKRPKGNYFKTLLRAHMHKPKNKFGDPQVVFMHVGKTGGTTINNFFQCCHKMGLRVPLVLNHNWSFRMARIRYPKARIIVSLRDPLERAVSGFNSRLRAGRPLGHPWRIEEAIAFGHLKNVKMFTDALCSDEQYDISAALFCFRNIDHLRRGYKYNFDGLQKRSEVNNDLIETVRIEQIRIKIPNLVKELNPNNINDIPDIRTLHNAPISSASYLGNISDKNIDKIHNRMRMEYETYHIIESYVRNS